MNEYSFNEELCSYLEKYLSEAFRESEQKEIKSLWCDGVLLPILESQLTKKSVNDTREVRTSAFIGCGDTHKFELIICFGKYSLRRYAKEKSLLDCLAAEQKMRWIKVDVTGRTIELQLK
ncbi:hypothetical protein K3G63_09265 [Hymenobacter sp. HSC-4F20]|uniref:hypothetical protein n=1 Tax=Hymenobacter sp. HSC-4F20 TaxID=2864135 RepID=UPI001C73880B|nr:hypothetical protein [Hymenobacter sp. HSC-4F20]MBX0290625.1 hypothetical protein [Hymenobacter sp. HSC-4F20]